MGRVTCAVKKTVADDAVRAGLQTRDDAVMIGKCASGEARSQACNLQTAICHTFKVFALLGVLLEIVMAKTIQRQHHNNGCLRLAIDIGDAYCGVSQ